MGKTIKFSTSDAPYYGNGDGTINLQGDAVYLDIPSVSTIYVNSQSLSLVLVPVTSSYSITSSYSLISKQSTTASYSLATSQATSASYSITASYALNGGGSGSGGDVAIMITGSGLSSSMRRDCDNDADGNYSSVLGGTNNSASGTYSFVAGGYSAVADKYSQNSHAAGNFAVAGDAQTSILVSRVTTTGSSNTELYLNGDAQTARLVIGTDCIWGFTTKVICTNRTGGAAFWQLKGCIKNVSGTVSIVGNIEKTVFAKDTAVNNCDANVEADDTNKALLIKATGLVGTDIRWVARTELVEVIRDTSTSV